MLYFAPIKLPNQATYFCASVLTSRLWVKTSKRLCFCHFWLFEQLV